MGNSFLNCMNSSTINPLDEEQFSPVLIKAKQTPPLHQAYTNSTPYDYSQQYPFTHHSVISFCLNNNIPNITQENSSFNPPTSIESNEQDKDHHADSFSFIFALNMPNNKGPRDCILNQINFQIEETSQFFKAIVIETHFAFEFMRLPIGFIEYNECVYIAYPLLSLSLEELIMKDLLDLRNKLIIIKNIISALKTIYDNDLSIDDLKLNNILFTNKRLCLKLKDIRHNSHNNESNKRAEDIYSLGIIVLSLFANCIVEGDENDMTVCINQIEHVYHRAFVIGLLRKRNEDRPNINEVIQIYNEIIMKNDIKIFNKEEIEHYII